MNLLSADKQRKQITDDEAKIIRLGILKELDSFCKQNELKYYLGFGTLIGAIRHHGFIPWDDDCDVWMTRHDLDRFIKLYQDNELYRVSHNLRDDDHFWGFVRFIDNRTTMKLGDRYIIGVNVEIYPLDACPDIKILRKIFIRLLEKFSSIQHKRTVTTFYAIKNMSWKRSSLKTFPTKVFLLLYYAIGTCFNGFRTKDFLSIFDTPYGLRPLKREWFKEVKRVKFEGLYLDVPVGYDGILRIFDGDYMSPPPPEEQIPSHNGNYFWK